MARPAIPARPVGAEPEPQAWHRHLGFTSNGIIENIADEGIGEVVFRLSFDDEDDDGAEHG